MAVTLADVQADTGEIYDALNNGTTAATSMITLAENFISDITGTTTTFDTAIRFFADTLLCNQVLGGVDPVSKTIGNLNIGAKELRAMRDEFMELSKMALKIKGYSADGLAVRAQMVNT
jgi:hypothetical protein